MLIDYFAAIRALLMRKSDEDADAPLAGSELLWAGGVRCAAEDDSREWAQYGIGAF